MKLSRPDLEKNTRMEAVTRNTKAPLVDLLIERGRYLSMSGSPGAGSKFEVAARAVEKCESGAAFLVAQALADDQWFWRHMRETGWG